MLVVDCSYKWHATHVCVHTETLCSLGSSQKGVLREGSWQHACPLPRYRPAQKSDSLGDGSAHSNVHGMAEPTMAAQGQHHQQYIGECRARAPGYTVVHESSDNASETLQ